MFEFEVDTGLDGMLSYRARLVESKFIRVGIKNKSEHAAIPSETRTRSLPNYSASLRVRSIDGRNPDLTLEELLGKLDSWGLFTDITLDRRNERLIDIFDVLTEVFLTGEYDHDAQARVENAARALVRNRILERRMGNNSAGTVDEKGFDMPMMDTGALFTAIRAWLEEQ